MTAKLEKPVLKSKKTKIVPTKAHDPNYGGARPGAGRMAFEPTDSERKQVEALSGYGLPIEQIAVLIASPRNHPQLAGGRVINLDDMVSRIRRRIIATGVMSKNAIPERFDLLRTMQLVFCGYYRISNTDSDE